MSALFARIPARLRDWILLALPPLLCLAFHWRLPFTWFRIDDFAWLGLHQQVHGVGDLFRALFEPQAQGTIRFLSDRLYFLVLGAIFGLWAGPFHIVGFATWFGILTLMQRVGTLLTGSRAAGFWAALLWSVAPALGTPLAWPSAYNQLLCALLVLTAFYARLRWLDTGLSKYRWIEAIAYLAGFGALEIIVVYPAIVLMHALSYEKARAAWRSALWMYFPAGLFAAAHFLIIPKDPIPAYQLIIDSRLPQNLLHYFGWTIGPSDADALDAIAPGWYNAGLFITAGLATALLGFLIRRTILLDRRPWFLLAWFLLFLAPVLPLPNHVFTYYLVLPGIGLAWLAGAAIASSGRIQHASGSAAILLTAILVSLYLGGAWLEDQAIGIWHLRVTSHLRLMMRAAEQTAHAYPNTTLVLQGVDEELFQGGFRDDPFRLIGLSKVVLAPGADEVLDIPVFKDQTRFRTTRDALLPLLANGQARVLNVAGDTVRDVTRPYRVVAGTQFLADHMSLVTLGDPLFAGRINEGWYPAENGARWMSRRATVTLAGPPTSMQKLRIEGYVPAASLATGPLDLRLLADDQPAGVIHLLEGDKPFSYTGELPLTAQEKPALRITLEVNHTFRPANDARDLGLVVKSIEIR